MSGSIDSDMDLDLHFLPAWAKEPSNKNLYANFEGEGEGRGERRRGDRPPGRRREGGPPREGGAPRGERRPPRPEGERRRPFDPRRREEGRPRPGPQREFRQENRPPKPEELPQVKVVFRPDDKGVDSLSRQIKMTGRAYPLFGVAQMILAKPERHAVILEVMKGPDGQILQPLFVCALDDSVWLSEDDAVNYALDKHFNTFYQAEKTAVEPPKGTYTFVAQCGISGVVLGPPNHHDYQNQLRKLHAERFSRMPFDVFKSRVRIVRDEAVIQKWVESQSFRTEYVCLNMAEPLRLKSMEEVQKHFRENHLPIIIKQGESHTLNGAASRSIRCGPLQRLVRTAWEEQKRFPLQIATILSQQFAARGLQFFKVNKNVTHVAVARPHFLDLDAIPVSEGVKRIVNFINEHPRCSRRQLFEALAPARPAPATIPAATPAEPASAEAASESAPEAPAAEPAPAPAIETSPEATAVISDLHWLIHQGHVIEFADGVLETAKKPLPKPPPKPQAPPPAVGVVTTPAQSVPTATAEPAPVPESPLSEPSAAEATPESAPTEPSPSEPAAAEAPPVAAPATEPDEPVAPAPIEEEPETVSAPAPVPEPPPAEPSPTPEPDKPAPQP